MSLQRRFSKRLFKRRPSFCQPNRLYSIPPPRDSSRPGPAIETAGFLLRGRWWWWCLWRGSLRDRQLRVGASLEAPGQNRAASSQRDEPEEGLPASQAEARALEELLLRNWVLHALLQSVHVPRPRSVLDVLHVRVAEGSQVGQQIARLARDGVRPSSEHAQLTFRSKYFPSSPYLAEVTVLLVPPQALLPVTGALTVTLAPTKLVLVMVTPFAPCMMNPISLSLSLSLSRTSCSSLSPALCLGLSLLHLGPIGSRDLGPRKTNLALSPNAKIFSNISIRKTRFRFFQSSPTGGDRHEVIERARAQRESERERGRGGPGHGGR